MHKDFIISKRKGEDGRFFGIWVEVVLVTFSQGSFSGKVYRTV